MALVGFILYSLHTGEILGDKLLLDLAGCSLAFDGLDHLSGDLVFLILGDLLLQDLYIPLQISKALGLEHSGVAAYLNGKAADYRQNLDEIQPGLFVLPVGTLPPNPTELLLSDNFKTMIEQMRSQFDYIFLDCPPIDLVADSSIITETVDMTVFVMRAGLMDKRVLPVIEDLYKSKKYKHMTMILNSVDIQYKKYGYGRSGYGYGYGYGNEVEK